ncbi:MAG TPA: aminopeptidase N, partial [Streptosporangiaceae bacterium]
GDLPNATFSATLSGFRDPDQEELLAPFAEPFFDVVEGIWRDWGSDMAQYFAEVAYPATVISQRALDSADDYLSRTSLPAPLRRLLTEGRDDVARALRCRQRDARAGDA